MFDVHRLVHLVTRNWLAEKNKLSIWADRALARLVEVIPAGGHTDQEQWTRHLPHGIHLTDTVEVCSDNDLVIIKLLDRIGRCQYSLGQYIGAENVHRRALRLGETWLGKEHQDTLISMNELGVALSSQGKYAEAEVMHRATMLQQEQLLGKEHPSTLTSMVNLASTFWNQGRWDAAEELEVQVMETRKKKLGADHPSTLTSMNNLAFTWKGSGKETEAVRLMDECVQSVKRVLGLNHPNTLSSCRTLAVWKGEQDDVVLLVPGAGDN